MSAFARACIAALLLVTLGCTRGPAPTSTRAGEVRVRPLGDRAWIEKNFPASERWNLVAYEIDAAGVGGVELRHGFEKRLSTEALPARDGTLVVAFGLRSGEGLPFRSIVTMRTPEGRDEAPGSRGDGSVKADFAPPANLEYAAFPVSVPADRGYATFRVGDPIPLAAWVGHAPPVRADYDLVSGALKLDGKETKPGEYPYVFKLEMKLTPPARLASAQ